MRENTKIKRIIGVSLLCSSPGWGNTLAKLPRSCQRFVLAVLDELACLVPAISDVVVVTSEPK
jgi:hypothetical protein